MTATAAGTATSNFLCRFLYVKTLSIVRLLSFLPDLFQTRGVLPGPAWRNDYGYLLGALCGHQIWLGISSSKWENKMTTVLIAWVKTKQKVIVFGI